MFSNVCLHFGIITAEISVVAQDWTYWHRLTASQSWLNSLEIMRRVVM